MLLRATVSRIALHVQPRMLMNRQARPSERLRLLIPEANVHIERATLFRESALSDWAGPEPAGSSNILRWQASFKMGGVQRTGLATRLAEQMEAGPAPIPLAEQLHLDAAAIPVSERAFAAGTSEAQLEAALCDLTQPEAGGVLAVPEQSESGTPEAEPAGTDHPADEEQETLEAAGPEPGLPEAVEGPVLAVDAAVRVTDTREPGAATRYLRQLFDKSVELQIIEELHCQTARLVRRAPGQTSATYDEPAALDPS